MMFGVIFYTVAGRYENNVYKKISLMNIIVKFGTLTQYAHCDFHMNTTLKPFIDDLINSKDYIFDDRSVDNGNVDVKWAVDDVVARRSFFVWEDKHDSQQHIDVTNIVFPKPPIFWVVQDSMFEKFVKTLFRKNKEINTMKKRKIYEEKKNTEK